MNLSDFIDELPKISSPFAVLIGERTDYSVSPLMHNTAAKVFGHNFVYYGVNVHKEDFSLLLQVLNHPNFVGANITIPYKETILKYATEQSTLVSKLKAANVLIKTGSTTFRAENTDVYGFTYPLQQQVKDKTISLEQAVIFGTGGASRAAAEGLSQLGIEAVYFVSRNPESGELSYSNWQEHIKPNVATILVNGSPLGMTVQKDKSPISLELMKSVKPLICYDLIYNPAETAFLKFAREMQVPIRLNGLEMLIQQASESYRLWNGVGFPFETVRAALLSTGLELR
jgi:shikimate dehydrogenase